MRIIHLGGANSVTDPTHGEAHAGADGVFDLPQPFADHLLTTAAGTWRGETHHASLLSAQAIDELRDPQVAVRVLAELRDRVASLEADRDTAAARIRDLEDAVSTPGADPAESGEDDPEESDGDEDTEAPNAGAETEASDIPDGNGPPSADKKPAAAKKTTARRK